MGQIERRIQEYTEQLVRDADVQEGARAIGFTLQTPDVGMVGVVDDISVRALLALPPKSNPDALLRMGWMYANGRGLPRDDSIAFRFAS